MRIVENVEKKGLELYFDGKPIKKVRDVLKLNGFRWHNVKKCWYAKKSDNVVKVANALKLAYDMATKKTTKKDVQKLELVK